ncbi:MAG: hypothetical protein KDE55_04135 [Novosphingobium sp.]|nr:hypothetical protein [Novosphingobium sp.]
MKYSRQQRQAIETAVDRILSSGVFGQRSRLRELLGYIVGEELEGRGDRLKAYAIGIDVFARPVDFNPNNDSIVRVEMARLRQALDVYYAGAGSDNPIRIGFSRGSYRPHFDTAPGTPAAAPPPMLSRLQATPSLPGGWLGFYLLGAAIAVVILAGLWLLTNRQSSGTPDEAQQASDRIPVVVKQFHGTPGDEHSVYVAEIVSDQIVSALARSKSLSVFNGTADSAAAGHQAAGAPDALIKYLVTGNLQVEPDWSRVTVELSNADTGNIVWAQTYRRGGRFITVQDELVRTIAAELRPQIYNAAKRAIAQKDPETASAWQLYLQATWSPGETVNSLAWQKEQLALARRALELDPDLGQAHAVLAEKLSYLANLDPASDTEAARNEADYHARRALELASDDADTVFNVAVHFKHEGKIAEAAQAVQRTYDLDPNHVLARLLVRFKNQICTTPTASAVRAAIVYDANLSPDNPVRWVTLYWLARLELNRGALEDALLYARRSLQIFASPAVSLQVAAILNQLGRTAEAIALVDTQRVNWPTLDLRHYASRVIHGECDGRPRTPLVRKIYDDLADAYENRKVPNAAQ